MRLFTRHKADDLHEIPSIGNPLRSLIVAILSSRLIARVILDIKRAILVSSRPDFQRLLFTRCFPERSARSYLLSCLAICSRSGIKRSEEPSRSVHDARGGRHRVRGERAKVGVRVTATGPQIAECVSRIAIPREKKQESRIGRLSWTRVDEISAKRKSIALRWPKSLRCAPERMSSNVLRQSPAYPRVTTQWCLTELS